MRERGAQAQEGLSTSSRDAGSTEGSQQAAGREKDRSVAMMEQQRGNTQHRVKPKCVEPQKSFPFFQLVLPACCRVTPGTELCLALSVCCSREVKDGYISVSK